MHQQLRVAPVASPPDLEKLLGVLEQAGVNIIAAGGGGLELGSEFAFAPDDDDVETAWDALVNAGYQPRRLLVDKDYKLCWLTNDPGQLKSCISEVAQENIARGRVIQDILIGVERDEKGRIPVQVYSVEVKTAASLGEPSALPGAPTTPNRGAR
jgi:hypothetical protein